MMLATIPKKILIYGKLTRLLFIKRQVMKKTFEVLNEDITSEMLNVLKYNHITDHNMNSFLYGFKLLLLKKERKY